MSSQALFAMLVSITALASYINHRYLKLPKTIGLTMISILLSLLLMAGLKLIPGHWTGLATLHRLMSGVNFRQAVLDGMLSYLLFASALHINVLVLRKQFVPILSLASVGVVISALLTGSLLWCVSEWFGMEIPFVVCLLFGTIIAPTDPIAVLSVFKTNKNIPVHTRIQISGEALFNDAFSILLFVLVVGAAFGNGAEELTPGKITLTLLHEAGGGLAVGFALGIIGNWMLARIDDAEVAILITLALTSGGFLVARKLGVSSPLAMVVTGLVIGNHLNRERYSGRTITSLDRFWGLVDEVLNAFLFVLIGLEMLTMHFDSIIIPAGVIAFIIVLGARLISVSLPMLFIEKKLGRSFWLRNIVMTWGGLRGGISIALALSVPGSNDMVVSVTYVVVLISILFQGATFKPLLNRVYPRAL